MTLTREGTSRFVQAGDVRIHYHEAGNGPVLLCMEVETLEEAIALMNANPFGNGCSIFTASSGGRHPTNTRRAF